MYLNLYFICIIIGIYNKYILIFKHRPSLIGTIINFKPGQLETEKIKVVKIYLSPNIQMVIILNSSSEKFINIKQLDLVHFSIYISIYVGNYFNLNTSTYNLQNSNKLQIK